MQPSKKENAKDVCWAELRRIAGLLGSYKVNPTIENEQKISEIDWSKWDNAIKELESHEELLP